uniref:UDP-xylose and UDP-N-acetylglucosamine transporter n=1 Tax=Cacopsylla melanoneura TaxID=428564 RepID=A0A8D8LZ24_9HEMI
MGVYSAIVSVFIGCCSNVVFLELYVKEDPGGGNLITFSQFAFIALHGFVFTSKLGTAKSHIKVWDYALLVVMFFVTNVCNNYAFDFNIAMPLHMIFRAGSLITNMIMGIYILNKVYTLDKYLSVIMITLGIIICTIMSSQEIKKYGVSDEEQLSYSENLFWWSLGIALLTIALFISARMGIYQEVLYKTHGKYPYEALYFTHLLPLPAFAFLYSNLYDHWLIALNSKPLPLPPYLDFITIPSIVFYLIGNVLTQYLCISSVYYLTTECNSLTVTLVITLRKFASLLFSIVYFQNEFTVYHWIGTFLVFVGTVIFTQLVPSAMSYIRGAGGEKTKEKKKVK